MALHPDPVYRTIRRIRIAFLPFIFVLTFSAVQNVSTRIFLVVLWGCANLPPSALAQTDPAPKSAPENAEPAVRTMTQVTLGAVGDVLMHGAVKQSAAAHRVPAGPGD